MEIDNTEIQPPPPSTTEKITGKKRKRNEFQQVDENLVQQVLQEERFLEEVERKPKRRKTTKIKEKKSELKIKSKRKTTQTKKKDNIEIRLLKESKNLINHRVNFEIDKSVEKWLTVHYYGGGDNNDDDDDEKEEGIKRVSTAEFHSEKSRFHKIGPHENFQKPQPKTPNEYFPFYERR